MNVRSFTGLLLVVWMMLVAAVPTHAAKPVFRTIEISTSPEALAQCNGFDVLVTQQGRIKVSIHRDRSGNVTKELSRYHIFTTFTNSATGKSISGPTASVDKFTSHQDGSMTIVGSGRGGLIIEGQLVYVTGKIVLHISAEGEEAVLFQAGKMQNLCSLLD